MWVIDVTLLGGSLKVVECNSLNTSGLYGCDIKSIVEHILVVGQEEVITG
jgi:hypothetical protein